jgi:hypothetical protein
MTTLKSFAYATIAATLVLVGCGDDTDTADGTTGVGNSGNVGNTGGTGATGGDGGTGGVGGQDDGPPALGDQVDRMGRPAINTALNKTFAEDAERAEAEDAWNQNDNPAQWVEAFSADVAAATAIYDGANTFCDDNAITSCQDPAVPNAQCYGTISQVLADDRLWVNTTFNGNSLYLGVEAEALGLLPAGTADVGGRRPVDDVIERSYSVLALGAVAGLDDNIPVKAATQAAYEAGFPYLAEPNTGN